MRMQHLIAATCVVVSTAACGDDHGVLYTTGPSPFIVAGSGRMITESRAVSGFSSITVSAGINAVVTAGTEESLTITAEDNIAPLIEAGVVDGRLTIGWRPGAGSVRSLGVVCRIGARSLQGVIASAGSAVQADAINAHDFFVGLSGAASFTGSGSVDQWRIDLSGASRVQAPGLTARSADATLSGASVALVRVSGTLLVHASGASMLDFLGDPAVQADVSGASLVRRLGP